MFYVTMIEGYEVNITKARNKRTRETELTAECEIEEAWYYILLHRTMKSCSQDGGDSVHNKQGR